MVARSVAIRGLAAAVFLAVSALAPKAEAHWCHDLWASTYQIVVRPASDTLDVPASGNAYLDIWVQNNMGYPLEDFSITAQATSFNIALSVVGQPDWATPAQGGYLMSGERRTYQMSVSAGSASQLLFEDVEFFVGFGTGAGGQDNEYGRVMNLDAGAGIASSPLDSFYYTGPADNGAQAIHLHSSAEANFGNVNTALQDLLLEFCSGRASWAGGAPSEPITSYCSDNGRTSPASNCPTSNADGTINKYDWTHLWAAGEIAYRSASLSNLQRDDFRARLWCSWQRDPNAAFRAFSIFLLGHIGDDASGTYAPQIASVISGGSTLEQGLAEAALYLMDGSNAAAVTTNTGSSNQWVALTNSAARGIRAQDDTAVIDGVIAQTESLYPEGSDNGFGITAGQMLNVITWARRTWAPNGYGIGNASYFQPVAVDAVAPAAPQNVACAPFASAELQATWDQVILDVGGGAETVVAYGVYWGRVSRPGTSTQPGDGFDYDHLDSTGSIFFNPTPLTGGDTYYVAITATDAAGNESVYSAETSCVAPIPQADPVAAINCSPTSGDTPLDINCDATGSSDTNNDITDYFFSVDGGTETSEPTGLFSTQLSAVGGHTIMVRVVDSTARFDTATTSITVTDPAGTNQPPTAVAGADVTSGVVSFTVNFSSTGSNDLDAGDTLSFSWDFRDGSALSTQADPTHTFTVAGSYDVTLTVSDDGTPPYSAIAVVPIVAIDPSNTAPDLTLVTASPLFGAPPLQVHFDALGIVDAENDRVFVDWDFGDGSAVLSGELGVDPVDSFDYTYISNGNYTVTLTANDDGAPSVSAVVRTFNILVSRNTPPDTTAATVSPMSGTMPVLVDLDASGCTDPDGDNISFEWQLDSPVGGTASVLGASGQYVLDAVGTWTIDLVLTDDGSPPIETRRTFQVVVDDPGDTGGSGGAGATGPEEDYLVASVSCSATDGSAGTLFALLLLGMLTLGRRRV